jgi:hypothetical protein
VISDSGAKRRRRSVVEDEDRAHECDLTADQEHAWFLRAFGAEAYIGNRDDRQEVPKRAIHPPAQVLKPTVELAAGHEYGEKAK